MSENIGLRTGTSHGALMAGLAAGLGMLGSQQALAQTTTLEPIPLEGEERPPAPQAQSDDSASGEGTGESVAVEIGAGAASPNTLNASTGSGRLSGDVQGTPQIINVIPQKTIQEQGITTLEQALSNVPGVTVRIGEGNGGLNGDQFMIRGLEAKGDLYVDGLRDFGVYVRDSFAYESVQVFKGPSSETFGVGTTGGAINSEMKKAHLGDKYRFEAAFGTDPLVRGGFDINKQLGDTTAIRVIGMGTEQDIADRDHVFNDRYGALVDFGTGIGTDTTWHLSYFHQHYDRMPDFGVPIITPLEGDVATFGSLGKPATEFGLDRSNFYGKDTDKDVGNVHTLTSRLETRMNDWLTINNDTRIAYYDRDLSATVPGCANTAPYASSCTGDFLNGGNPSLTFGGGNPGYYQESWGFQNILSAKADFHTGALRHEAVIGIDYLYQDDDRIRNSVFDSSTDLPNNGLKIGSGQPILDPVFGTDGSYYIGRNPNDLKRSKSSNIAVFASDRVWFTPEISVLAGLRWDYFDVSYDTYNGTSWTHLDQQSDFVSPKASLIWEPTANQTYYLSWATSANINGQFPTNATNPVNANPIQPEENESWEIGGKWSLLDGRLGLTAAAFQIDKDNARYTNDLGDAVITGEEQRVRGIELGISGMITPAWFFSAAYAYLDTEVRSVSGDSSHANAGNRVANAPQNAFSIWTTYNMSEHFQQLPGTWLVGGGITYRDEVFTSSANTAVVPETFSLDLMTSYSWDKYRIALNAYNLTDELNYSAVWTNRAIPSSGRAFTLTLGAEF